MRRHRKLRRVRLMITATEISVTLPKGDPEWVDKFLNAWGALAEAVDDFL